jgi:hypothetical protein
MANYSHPSKISPVVEIAIGGYGSEKTLFTLDAYGNPVFNSGATTKVKGIVQNFTGVFTLAKIIAGINPILAGVANTTINILNFKILVNGTAGGSGNFILEDTNGTPVAIVTVAEAQLAGCISPSTASITLGAGFMAALTTGKGIQIPAAASLTTLTSVTVSIDYVLT